MNQTKTLQPSPATSQRSFTKLDISTKIIPHSKASIFIMPIIILVLLGLNLVAGLLLKNASQESQTILSHLEALKRNQQNVKQLESSLATYKEKIDQINGVLLKEKDIPQFIQFMTDTANATNSTLSLNFTSNQPTQLSNKLWIIPINLQLSTTHNKLNEFLTLVHSSKYQIRFKLIESISNPVNKDTINVKLAGQLFVDTQFALP